MGIDRITPKLVVSDAAAAIDYYTTVFDATVLQRHNDSGRVVFAELALPDGPTFQLKDADEYDRDPHQLGSPGLLLTLTTDTPDTLAARMTTAGGHTVFPVADQPYGSRQGRIRDPFGHEWIVGTAIPAESD